MSKDDVIAFESPWIKTNDLLTEVSAIDVPSCWLK